MTRRRRNLAGLAFALPALALFALFAIYPMLRVVYLSLFDYNLTSPGRYVGLHNYDFLLHDAASTRRSWRRSSSSSPHTSRRSRSRS